MSRLTNEDWAQICADMLSSLPQRDRVVILGLAIARVASGGTSTPEAAVVPTVAAPPAKDAPSGKVVAHPGDKCYCAGCKANVYEVTSLLYENGLTINTFLKSYKPLGDVRPLSRNDLEQVLPDGKGNLFIDCPVCQGKKTLRIIQGDSAQAVAAEPIQDGKFGSLDPKSIGIPT